MLNIDVVLNNSSPSFEPPLTQPMTGSPFIMQIIPWSVLLTVIGTLLFFTFDVKCHASGDLHLADIPLDSQIRALSPQKSLLRNSKEITKPAVFVQPVTL